jgi:hypothetical protein
MAIDVSEILFGFPNPADRKLSPFLQRLQESAQKFEEEAGQSYVDYKRDPKEINPLAAELIGPKASAEEKFAVAQRLIALRDNKEAFTEYVLRLKLAREYSRQVQEDMEAVEDLKSRVLLAELKPGQVTPESLSQMANQQLRAVGIGDRDTISLGANSKAQVPWNKKYGLKVDDAVAFDVAETAKRDPNFHFVTSPSAKDRNAVVDSLNRLKEHDRVADAAFNSAIHGKALSPLAKSQIEKASANTGFWRNAAEYTGHGLLKTSKTMLPGIFGKDHEKDSRYQSYLKLRGDFISSYASLLNGENMRRYLTTLKAQQQQLIDSGGVSPLELQDLQSLISATEKQVEELNKKDHEQLAKALNGLNDEALSSTKKLTDEEESMWKFRVLQVFLMTTPFGLVNILGPAFDILAPILDGQLQFGEGLAQAINNIPFFGDIFNFLELDKVVEFTFDEVPLIGDITGAINSVTDSVMVQEFLGAAAPMAGGSPLVPLAVAGLFSFMRFDAEITHAGKSSDIQAENRKKLSALFEKFGKGFSKAKVQEAVRGYIEKQAEIVNESFAKRHLVEFIANAARENDGSLAIFDKIKIKFKASEADPEKQLSLRELMDEGYDLKNTQNVFAALSSGADKKQLDKMVNHVFAFEALEGDVVKKNVGFAALDDAKIEANAKKPREEYCQEKSLEYVKEKMGIEGSGKDLAEKYKSAKEQMVNLQMRQWQEFNHVLPTPPGNSVEEPHGTNMADLFKGMGAAAPAVRA